eukprot:3828106-Pyramimonas_sp.AAC.1
MGKSGGLWSMAGGGAGAGHHLLRGADGRPAARGAGPETGGDLSGHDGRRQVADVPAGVGNGRQE